MAKKFDGSANRNYPGRPRVDPDVEQLIVRLATDNRDWGDDRIVGALANLGHEVSDQTVGNILQRHGIPPAPERKKTTTWKEFIRSHQAVLAATDFFTTEVWTLSGLVTYYVLFVMHVATRRVHLNPQAERWVRSVKDECLSKLILFGEPALRPTLRAYLDHFHGERNHQGKDNLLLFQPTRSCRRVWSGAANVLVDCSSSTTGRPHEFFDHTSMRSCRLPQWFDTLLDFSRALNLGDAQVVRGLKVEP